MGTDYKEAGVDIDAGNEAVKRIKTDVASTFTPGVLTGLGSFGSLFDLSEIIKEYQQPVLVQSIDGVGTKVIIARMMNTFDSIGRDLVSACANDILVMGAKPLTFLDYIANDKLDPEAIEIMVRGMAHACRETGVALVGGETAEMPDTYLPGEHDLVGVISGIVEKDKIITGKQIQAGDVLLGLPSSGLHTNGYSLARRIIFDVAGLSVWDNLDGIEGTIGEALLEPHVNYTNEVLVLLESSVDIHGIAHITGGGFMENIPRVLPKDCAVEIRTDSFPGLPIFWHLQRLGDVKREEMYRTFNMGIGMIVFVPPKQAQKAKILLRNTKSVFEIGHVKQGNREVTIR